MAMAHVAVSGLAYAHPGGDLLFSDDGTNIRSVDTRPGDDGVTNVDFVVETVDVRHLTKLQLNLRKVPGVRDVHRVQKI